MADVAGATRQEHGITLRRFSATTRDHPVASDGMPEATLPKGDTINTDTKVSDCDPEGGEWADDLARYGFSLISNVAEESLDTFVAGAQPRFGR
jgi:hypothetical protein